MGQHAWLDLCFGLLECTRAALTGMPRDVLLASEAAIRTHQLADLAAQASFFFFFFFFAPSSAASSSSAAFFFFFFLGSSSSSSASAFFFFFFFGASSSSASSAFLSFFFFFFGFSCNVKATQITRDDSANHLNRKRNAAVWDNAMREAALRTSSSSSAASDFGSFAMTSCMAVMFFLGAMPSS